MKKKYVIVGAGGRALSMFARPLVRDFQEVAQLAGICDVNPHRAQIMSDECGGGIPIFTDFDEMIDTIKPDSVIITTIDSLHHEYIIRTLEAGCDAISEKPMTIDAEKTRAIMEAEKRTGKKVTVTFNVRYLPYAVKIKELLMSEVIGKVHSLHLEWFLNTSHGADYFRRWHRHMNNSGGLLVHKSTHHFDMINWWLDDEPESLYAFGDLKYYGPNREERGERCLTCDYKNSCSHYFDINANEFTKNFYHEAEAHDGYIRDQCIFGENIDIYDTMSVNVKYRKGTQLSYSLTAYNPMEGWKVSFIGDKGRMEAEAYEILGQKGENYNTVKVYNRAGELTTVQVNKGGGGHGGSDERLRKMIFEEGHADPLGQMAGSRAGAMSLLIGAGANLSIAQKKPIVIADLLEQK